MVNKKIWNLVTPLISNSQHLWVWSWLVHVAAYTVRWHARRSVSATCGMALARRCLVQRGGLLSASNFKRTCAHIQSKHKSGRQIVGQVPRIPQEQTEQADTAFWCHCLPSCSCIKEFVSCERVWSLFLQSVFYTLKLSACFCVKGWILFPTWDSPYSKYYDLWYPHIKPFTQDMDVRYIMAHTIVAQLVSFMTRKSVSLGGCQCSFLNIHGYGARAIIIILLLLLLNYKSHYG